MKMVQRSVNLRNEYLSFNLLTNKYISLVLRQKQILYIRIECTNQLLLFLRFFFITVYFKIVRIFGYDTADSAKLLLLYETCSYSL